MIIIDDLRALDKPQRAAFAAGLLGWTLDAFDFFLLTFIVKDIADSFKTQVSTITVAITLTLMLRPLGAFVFGRLADRFGRRPVLMADVMLYAVLAFASAFSPNLPTLLILRAAFGFAMGGEWGIGSSLALESIPAKSRGVVSGILQEGYALGFLLASLVYLASPILHWRGLLMVSVVPALLVLYIRRHVQESPAWETSRTTRRDMAAQAKSAAPQPLASKGGPLLVFSLYGLSALAAVQYAMRVPAYALVLLPLGAGLAYVLRLRVSGGERQTFEHQIRLFWTLGGLGALWAYLVLIVGDKLSGVGLPLARVSPVVFALLALALLALCVRGATAAVQGRAPAHPQPGSLWDELGRRSGLLVYVVVLMTAFNLFSHGTQDLYPTFLKVQHKFAPGMVTTLTVLANLGAIVGGVLFGALSERIGRRRAIVLATLLALPMIPLWAFGATPLILGAGAFLIQIAVQGAWGVVPVHLNELSPADARGTFPGFAYQLGNFIASGNAVVQARIAESRHDNYGLALAVVAGGVAMVLAVLTLFGPEAKGVSFVAEDRADPADPVAV